MWNFHDIFLCCIFCVVFPCYIFLVLHCITSLSATASSAICLAYFCSESKEESSSLSLETRTDSLPCDLTVFISKIYECKQVELSTYFLATFANFQSPQMILSNYISIVFHFHCSYNI